MSYNVQIAKIGPSLNRLTNPQNPMLYNAFQSTRQQTSHKCSFPRQHLHPHVTYVSWTHQTQHSTLHPDQFSRFHTAHSREYLYFTVCVKTRL